MPTTNPVLSPVIYDKQEEYAPKRARAKYVPDFINGGLRLASVCEFSRPVFNPGKLENDPFDLYDIYLPKPGTDDENADDQKRGRALTDEEKADNIRRASHRAQLAVFDIAICNKFDLFSTLTFAPENVDRTSYEETYNALKIWLSNRVQRKGLKYIAVPEYHPKSKTAIHFHMLSNSEPVDLVDSGHKRHKQIVYNIPSWQAGFSTAQYISGDSSTDFCAKYVSKYMTKSGGNKIGGRYYLSGGDLVRPMYVYADSIEELIPDGLPEKYKREINQDWGTFREIRYI